MSLSVHRAAGMAAAITMSIFVSACADQKTTTSTFQKASDECSSKVIPQQYIVRFEDGTTTTVRAKSDADFVNGYLSKNLPQVKIAEPDYQVHTAMLSTGITPMGSQIDNWGPVKVDAGALWSAGIRGDGVKVAIVDTGLDITHPQLAKQIWANPGEQGVDAQGRNRATNGIDDDGDGYIDDEFGWNFVARAPLKSDNSYHGTHVAGIIAAAHNDTAPGPAGYVEGLAPGAKLMSLAFLDEQGYGSMSDGVRGIDYAVKNGAQVINASWGGTACSATLRDAIAGLEAKGVIFVAAAGNDGSDVDFNKEYPASLNLAAQITVGATGDHDYKAEYSNFGDLAVHIFAPGTDIISTIPGARLGALSGTSMATPFVTGAVALLLSAEPTAKVQLIRQALYNTAVKRSDYMNASRGRMNLHSTLAELRRLMGK